MRRTALRPGAVGGSRFGDRLRALRTAAGLSQRALAARVTSALLASGARHGCDVSYLSRIESGHVGPPSARMISALAAVLGTDEDELFALVGRVPPGFGPLLRGSPGARAFWAAALRAGLTEAEWQLLTAAIQLRAGHDQGAA